MNEAQIQSLIGLAVVVLVVFRFARRELRERTITPGRLWIRPALLVAITVYLVWMSSSIDPAGDAEMWIALIAGVVLGVITGALILANTHFRPADRPNAILVKGNRITFAIWICALLVRLAARYLLPHGADPRAQLPLNCGTVSLVAAAFVVIGFGFHREIVRTVLAPKRV